MLNIVIAEDDRDDFLMLEEAIENTLPQFQISHSRDGKEFLQKVDEQHPPDLIFLDLNLPKRSGLDCLIDIRKRKSLQATPVIIYSTSSDLEDIDLCYKNGCTLYLVKPRSFKDLLVQVKKIFAQELAEEAAQKSAEQFRLFTQAISDQVYKISADWDAFYHLTGSDPSGKAQPGRAWMQQHVAPEDQPAWQASIQQAIHNKTVLEMEYRVKQQDGRDGWAFFRAIPLLDEKGAIKEWFGATHDITKRKQAEAELQEEHYFLEQITDNTPHLIYVFDLDEQRFIYVNKRIKELAGIEQDYVYGMGSHLFKMVLHPDDLSRRVDYFNHLSTLKPGETREDEFRTKVTNGYRCFRSKDRIFKTEDGRVTQVIGLAEDVTYEKKLQEKLAEEKGGIGLN